MKKVKIAHWIFTGLISALLLMGASMYILDHEEVVKSFNHLGFPTWLIYPMAIAKFLGVMMLLTKFNKWLTEWAYAGIVFNLLLGFGAHLAISDDALAPLVALVLITGSYFTWKKLEKA
jgi:DoxX-like family